MSRQLFEYFVNFPKVYTCILISILDYFCATLSQQVICLPVYNSQNLLQSGPLTNSISRTSAVFISFQYQKRLQANTVSLTKLNPQNVYIR